MNDITINIAGSGATSLVPFLVIFWLFFGAMGGMCAFSASYHTMVWRKFNTAFKVTYFITTMLIGMVKGPFQLGFVWGMMVRPIKLIGDAEVALRIVWDNKPNIRK